MAKTGNAQSSQATPPGALFWQPGLASILPQVIPDENNGGFDGFSTTLSQSQSTTAKTSRFDQAGIATGYLAEMTFALAYTPGSQETLTPNPGWPFNLVQQLSLQLEVNLQTTNLYGWEQAVCAGYRPMLGGPTGFGKATQDGFWAAQNGLPSANWAQPAPAVGNGSGTAVTTSDATVKLMYEVPTAVLFDTYYDQTTGGLVTGLYERVWISPQAMAGNNRNVRPALQFAPLLVPAGQDTDRYAAVSAAANDSTSAASGTVETKFFRFGFLPTQNPAIDPPRFQWQYARIRNEVPNNGSKYSQFMLVSDQVYAGQLLSCWFYTWDPSASNGAGGIVPSSSYNQLQFMYGAGGQSYYNEDPAVNTYRWSQQHLVPLPEGCFGWDRGLTDDNRFTNERAINTINSVGATIKVTYNSGDAPSSSAQFCIVEELLIYVPSQ